jgi:DNA-binding GntR family transcriptional regulator
LLREQRIKIFNVEGGPQRGQVHHKRILDAMERHDSEMARNAMRAHLEQVREDSKATPDSKPSSQGKRAPVSSKVT